MLRRKAKRLGVLVQIVDADGAAIGAQAAERPVTGGWYLQTLEFFLREAAGEEALRAVAFIGDRQGGVAAARQFASGVAHGLERIVGLLWLWITRLDLGQGDQRAHLAVKRPRAWCRWCALTLPGCRLGVHSLRLARSREQRLAARLTNKGGGLQQPAPESAQICHALRTLAHGRQLLRRRQNLIDDTVFERLIGRHPEVAAGIGGDALDRLAGMVGEDRVEAADRAQQVLRLNLDIRGCA